MQIVKIYKAKKVDAKTNEILNTYLKKCIEEGNVSGGDNLPEIDFDSNDKGSVRPRPHCINVSYAGSKIQCAKEPLRLTQSLAPTGKPFIAVVYRWSGIQGVTDPEKISTGADKLDFNAILRGVEDFLNFLQRLSNFLVKTWQELLGLFGFGGAPADKKDPVTEAYVSESDLDRKISEIPMVHKPKKPKEKLPSVPITLTDINQLTDVYTAGSEAQAGLVILFGSQSQGWLQFTNEEGITKTMQNMVPNLNAIIPAGMEFPGDVTHILIQWANSPSTGANKDPHTDESGSLYGKIAFYDYV